MLIVFPLYTNELQCRKSWLRHTQPLIASFTSQTRDPLTGPLPEEEVNAEYATKTFETDAVQLRSRIQFNDGVRMINP